MMPIFIVLGVIALVPFLFAIGIAISVWRAWWLHPLWALVLVPLGVRPISFWHFLAIGMFFSSWLAWKTSHEPERRAKTDKDTQDFSGLITLVLWPVVTYYLVHWYMS